MPLRRSGRRAPAGPADLALRLLLQHAEWWEQLSPDDQQLLHELGGTHGEVVQWLEVQSVEHGPLTWSALSEAMQDQPWADTARGWVSAGLGDQEYKFEALRSILSVLQLDLLKQEADAIISGSPSAEDLVRYRELMAQIGALKRPANS